MATAKDSFVLYVDKDSNRVPHKEGESMKGISRIEIKKGDKIPKELLSDIILFNKEWIELAEDKSEEKPKKVDKKPVKKVKK